MTKSKGGRRYKRLRQIAHHLTWFLGTRCPNAIPLVFVVGYPKSGTTWSCRLVSQYLQLPYPKFFLLPIGFEAVVHGHEPVWKRYPRGVYVMRDGRDALVSQYFFMTRRIAHGDHPPLSSIQRRAFGPLVNKDHVHDNIARFIENQMARPHSSRLHWGDHVRSFYEVANPNVVLLRYEDLVREGPRTLAEAMANLTGEEPDLKWARIVMKRNSFARRSGRRRGQEQRGTFLRKGQPGDGVNHFTREAAEIFDHHCGEMLVRAGYEPDRSWVERVPTRAQRAEALVTADR